MVRCNILAGVPFGLFKNAVVSDKVLTEATEKLNANDFPCYDNLFKRLQKKFLPFTFFLLKMFFLLPPTGFRSITQPLERAQHLF